MFVLVFIDLYFLFCFLCCILPLFQKKITDAHIVGGLQVWNCQVVTSFFLSTSHHFTILWLFLFATLVYCFQYLLTLSIRGAGHYLPEVFCHFKYSVMYHYVVIKTRYTQYMVASSCLWQRPNIRGGQRNTTLSFYMSSYLGAYSILQCWGVIYTQQYTHFQE